MPFLVEDWSRVATKCNKKVENINFCNKLAKVEDIALIRGKTTDFCHIRSNNNNIIDVTAQNLLMLYIAKYF